MVPIIVNCSILRHADYYHVKFKVYNAIYLKQQN